MKKLFLYKKKQAQQLVEFAIVVPILMVILFIIVEFGAAINARVTLAEAVKTSMSEINKLNNIDGTTAAKISFAENFIKSKVIQYLLNHNISNTNSVQAKIKFDSTNSTAIVYVYYEYIPYFIIAGLSGSNITAIPFSSSQSINPHIFKPNIFPATPLTTEQLSKFSTNNLGNFIDSGALVDTTTFNYGDGVFNVKEHTAFLIRMYEGQGTYPFLEYNIAHARLVDWVGNDLLPPNLRINLRTGTLEVRSPYYQSGHWFDTKIPYVWVATSLGITHLIYVKFNSQQMLWPDNTPVLYKLRFNDSSTFYNRGMIFCGPASGVNCDADLRNSATVNERALRMNPKLGEGPLDPNFNSSYIIGTMEPIFIDTTTSPGLADFTHVKGFYYSYSSNYATWDQIYFISIAQPRIMSMTDSIYSPNMNNVALNPFYSPFQYRLKLFEHLPANANAGTFDRTQVANVAGDNDPDSTDANAYYQVDIIDVYIDSDGDGIPDAWDMDPSYFDVNVNNILDGNEFNVDMWTQTRCNGIVTGICAGFPDNVSEPIAPPVVQYTTAASSYYISTPYTLLGAQETAYTAGFLPLFKAAPFLTYTDAGGNKALYIDKNGTDYTRKLTTWWSLANAALRRPVKVNFINGTLSGSNISLNNSPELTFLNTNNIFSTNSYVTRTAPTVW